MVTNQRNYRKFVIWATFAFAPVLVILFIFLQSNLAIQDASASYDQGLGAYSYKVPDLKFGTEIDLGGAVYFTASSEKSMVGKYVPSTDKVLVDFSFEATNLPSYSENQKNQFGVETDLVAGVIQFCITRNKIDADKKLGENLICNSYNLDSSKIEWEMNQINMLAEAGYDYTCQVNTYQLGQDYFAVNDFSPSTINCELNFSGLISGLNIYKPITAFSAPIINHSGGDVSQLPFNVDDTVVVQKTILDTFTLGAGIDIDGALNSCISFAGQGNCNKVEDSGVQTRKSFAIPAGQNVNLSCVLPSASVAYCSHTLLVAFSLPTSGGVQVGGQSVIDADSLGSIAPELNKVTNQEDLNSYCEENYELLLAHPDLVFYNDGNVKSLCENYLGQ